MFLPCVDGTDSVIFKLPQNFSKHTIFGLNVIDLLM